MRISLLALGSAVLLGCGGDDTTGPPLATAPDILIVANASGAGSNAYDPNPLTISLAAKRTVKWRNNDGAAPNHTVTSDTGLFDSGNLSESNVFSFTFTATGTYTYHCSIHPSMTGTVIVNP